MSPQPDAPVPSDSLEHPPDDPFELFAERFLTARRLCEDDPTAMVLSTIGADGRPSSRYVLLKDVDRGGFVFYTNLTSRKAVDLAHHPFAALCFRWAPMGLQVRIEGPVEPVTDAEADAYFASRPRSHQISAWASRQSAPLASRADLERRVADCERQYEGIAIPRPSFWSGYRVIPDRIEFWLLRPDRLHDRLVYVRPHEQAPWTRDRLYP